MIRHTFFKTSTFLIITLFTAGAFASHSWNNYHWARTANPFTLLVNDSMTSDWDSQKVNAVNKWSQSDVLDLTLVSSSNAIKVRKRCPMKSGEIRLCNAAYGYNGWLGLATIGIDSTGHILQGTAQMNDSYSSYWTNVEEKNHVICQEIGHLFGLDHTSEDGSSQGTCMDYSDDPSSQWPNAHDFQELDTIYTHLDSFNSYYEGSSGGSTGGSGCNAPPGKGCNKNGVDVPDIPMGVRVYAGRYHELWVAPRKQGGWWVHHVFLAR